jgi:hypothetical protein
MSSTRNADIDVNTVNIEDELITFAEKKLATLYCIIYIQSTKNGERKKKIREDKSHKMLLLLHLDSPASMTGEEQRKD